MALHMLCFDMASLTTITVLFGTVCDRPTMALNCGLFTGLLADLPATDALLETGLSFYFC